MKNINNKRNPLPLIIGVVLVFAFLICATLYFSFFRTNEFRMPWRHSKPAVVEIVETDSSVPEVPDE